MAQISAEEFKRFKSNNLANLEVKLVNDSMSKQSKYNLVSRLDNKKQDHIRNNHDINSNIHFRKSEGFNNLRSSQE